MNLVNSNLLFFNLLKHPAALLVVGTVAFALWFGYGLNHDILRTKQQSNISHVKYERLKLGMSLIEAEAILGKSTKVKQSATTKVLVWENPDSSKITAIFVDNKLKEKRFTRR